MTTGQVKQHERVLQMMRVVFGEYLRVVYESKEKMFQDHKRSWLGVEQKFSAMQYDIPVFGKWDGVFQEDRHICLLETKNLSRIDEEMVEDTLTVNFQVMLYLWALSQRHPDSKLKVLYSVIRVPQLRQGKDETDSMFRLRVGKDIRERPDWYFMRFENKVLPLELKKWETTVLDPIIRDIQQWWDGFDARSLQENPYHYPNYENLQTKYGRCAMYDMIVHGTTTGYVRRKLVHPELEF